MNDMITKVEQSRVENAESQKLALSELKHTFEQQTKNITTETMHHVSSIKMDASSNQRDFKRAIEEEVRKFKLDMEDAFKGFKTTTSDNMKDSLVALQDRIETYENKNKSELTKTLDDTT